MMASCNHMKQIKHMPYPETQRTDVADDYFGTKVADPYRWLEDDNSEATAAWVKAQNAVTQDYLSQIPFRDAIRGRLTQLWNYPKGGHPWPNTAMRGIISTTTGCGTSRCSTVRRLPVRRARCSSIPIRSRTTGRWRFRRWLFPRTGNTAPARWPNPARTGWRFV